jgi:hypothetical protein
VEALYQLRPSPFSDCIEMLVVFRAVLQGDYAADFATPISAVASLAFSRLTASRSNSTHRLPPSSRSGHKRSQPVASSLFSFLQLLKLSSMQTSKFSVLDEVQLATGQIADAKDSRPLLDFTKPGGAALSNGCLKDGIGQFPASHSTLPTMIADDNFLFDQYADPEVLAKLSHPKAPYRLDFRSNQRSVQVYTANGFEEHAGGAKKVSHRRVGEKDSQKGYSKHGQSLRLLASYN